MADPVFALSPISARSAAPTEADYDAIREAFMETARGRWFLTEYAKRNRNADTNLVLDAVSRLESTLAAQKQDQRDRSQEIIAAIGALVIEARSEAAVLIAVRDAPDEDSPALKGVRVLREMAWKMRESGNDSRIPDLLSRQADAIEEGLKAAIDESARDHLLSIFDRLAGDVDALGHGDAAAAPSAQQQPSASAVAETAAVDETQAMADELQAVADAIADDGIADLPAEPDITAEAAPAIPASAPQANAAVSPAGYVTIDAGNAGDDELVWDEPAETAAAPDESVVANEIAAHAIADDLTSNEMAAADLIVTDTAEDEDMAAVPAAPRPVAVEAPVIQAAPQPRPEPRPVPVDAISTDRMVALEAALMAPVAEQAAPEPDVSMSLGAALLEKGIVARPDTPRADPLAPFKRMTQAERVAFFS